MISIIIPAYNCAESVGRTINSILTQTYTDYEIVVVNDGSADATFDVLTDFAKKNPAVKVYSISNGGAYAARLYGVGKAAGEWITFVDADDVLPANALELLISEDDGMADIIAGTLSLNGKDILPNKLSGLQSPENYMDALLMHETSIGPYAKLYRRDLFGRTSLELECRIHQNEDLLMLMKLSAKVKAIKIAPDKVVYDYILNPRGVSKQKRPLTEWFALFSLLAEVIKTLPYASALQKPFTYYRITTLYEQGVLKMNDFNAVDPQLHEFYKSVKQKDLPADYACKLAIIKSPFRRFVWGCVTVAKNRIKDLIKGILNYG